jgi:hypothetical protein
VPVRSFDSAPTNQQSAHFNNTVAPTTKPAAPVPPHATAQAPPTQPPAPPAHDEHEEYEIISDQEAADAKKLVEQEAKLKAEADKKAKEEELKKAEAERKKKEEEEKKLKEEQKKKEEQGALFFKFKIVFRLLNGYRKPFWIFNLSIL